MFNERVPVTLSVPVFFFQVGYAARNSEGALRAEIWENLIRKSEKMPIDYINHLTHNHSTLTLKP